MLQNRFVFKHWFTSVSISTFFLPRLTPTSWHHNYSSSKKSKVIIVTAKHEQSRPGPPVVGAARSLQLIKCVKDRKISSNLSQRKAKMGLLYKVVIFNYNKRLTLISSFSDAIIYHIHIHTGRNIHICCYKKQYSVLFTVLYVVSECQNRSQCSGIEYIQTFICPIFSFSQVHTVHIPCLCSVNNI